MRTKKFMTYLEEAELIVRLLGAELQLVETHYAYDFNEYNHKCEGLSYDSIAHHLWNIEDSVLIVKHSGQTRWIRFVFGNDFGELIADYSVGLANDKSLCHDNEKHYIDTVIDDVVCNYYDMGFTDMVCVMEGDDIYRSEEE